VPEPLTLPMAACTLTIVAMVTRQTRTVVVMRSQPARPNDLMPRLRKVRIPAIHWQA
jgi:hypothetical protein